MRRKKWFSNPSFWVSVIVLVVSSLALWQSNSANQIATEANEISRIDIEPAFVVESFMSYGIDIRDERDLQKIVRDRVIIRGVDEGGEGKNNGQYTWLLITNKGKGNARIFFVEIHYEFVPHIPRIKSFNSDYGMVIAPGEILALYLGYSVAGLTFMDEVILTYKTSLDEPNAIPVTFTPNDIFPYVLDPIRIKETDL